MTKEEAKREILFTKREVMADSWIDKAYDVAIKALEQEPSTEIQEILEYLDTTLHPIVSPDNWNVYSELHDMVSRLPPAQPEIIRCTECKHYREYDSKYVENAVVAQCMADRYPISETIPDGWFCAGAERKDDE